MSTVSKLGVDLQPIGSLLPAPLLSLSKTENRNNAKWQREGT